MLWCSEMSNNILWNMSRWNTIAHERGPRVRHTWQGAYRYRRVCWGCEQVATSRRISVSEMGTKAASFKLEADEIERVFGNSDDILSTWIVDSSIDEDICSHGKHDMKFERTEAGLRRWCAAVSVPGWAMITWRDDHCNIISISMPIFWLERWALKHWPHELRSIQANSGLCSTLQRLLTQCFKAWLHLFQGNNEGWRNTCCGSLNSNHIDTRACQDTCRYLILVRAYTVLARKALWNKFQIMTDQAVEKWVVFLEKKVH